MSDHLDYDNLRADTVRQGRQTDGRIRHYRPQVRRTAIPARQTPVHRDRHRRRPRLARPPGRLDARPRQRTPGSDWFRDADVADVIDAALFVGLTDWYPPNYDCGACGYATCAEFLHATKQLQTTPPSSSSPARKSIRSTVRPNASPWAQSGAHTPRPHGRPATHDGEGCPTIGTAQNAGFTSGRTAPRRHPRGSVGTHCRLSA
jgi:Putative Fe-S cluster